MTHINKKVLALTMALAVATSSFSQFNFSPGTVAEAATNTNQDDLTASNKKSNTNSDFLKIGTGIATPPAFNYTNFSIPDYDQESTEYYFGKNGNAFYALDYFHKSIDNDTVLDLIDTDANLGDGLLSHTWGAKEQDAQGYYSGQGLLNFVKGLTDKYFSIADQSVMKSKDVSVSQSEFKNEERYPSAESANLPVKGSVKATKLWLPDPHDTSYLGKALNTESYFYSYNNYSKVPQPPCFRKISSNIKVSDSTIPYGTCEFWSNMGNVDNTALGNGSSQDYKYITLYNGSILNHSRIDALHYVVPCCEIDLTKMLLMKESTSDTNSVSISPKRFSNTSQKFLMDVGTTKSSFNMPLINGKELQNVKICDTYDFDYEGASTSAINNGVNYVSTIIYDTMGRSLYYGNLKKIDSESGTVSFKVPDSLVPGNEYVVAFFQEEKCDSYKTDYASTPIYVRFTAEEKTDDGISNKPKFNSSNFPTLQDKPLIKCSLGTEKFYVADNGYTSDDTWELVDEDARIKGVDMLSNWGFRNTGQSLLEYTNNAQNYFYDWERSLMKREDIFIEKGCSFDNARNPKHDTEGCGVLPGARMWPLRMDQVSDSTNVSANKLGKSLTSNSKGYSRLRNFGNLNIPKDNVYSSGVSKIYPMVPSYYYYNDSIRYDNYISSSYSVNPAFALDLRKVFLVKPAISYKEKELVPFNPTSTLNSDSIVSDILVDSGNTYSNFMVTQFQGETSFSEPIDVYCKDTLYANYENASYRRVNSEAIALIYDKDGKILYYGRLRDIDSEDDQNGSLRIELPDTLVPNEVYTIALTNRINNYVSTPTYIKINVQPDPVITFDAGTNGGTVVERSTYPSDPGTSVETIDRLPGTILLGNYSMYKGKKQNYKFVGWNTDKNAHEGLKELEFDKDVTLYAIFYKDLRVRYYNSNAGNAYVKLWNNDSSTKVKYFPEPRNKYGFRPVGWYKSVDESQTLLDLDETYISGNTDFSVKYEPKSYTIEYYDGDTKLGESEHKFSISSPLASLDKLGLPKPGYHFDYWWYDYSCEKYDADSEVSWLNRDDGNATKLYAIQKPNNYKIEYYNDASKKGESSLVYDEPTTLATASSIGVEKTGYTLEGWVDTATGSAIAFMDKQEVKNLTTKDNDTIKLYAKWKPIDYKIYYCEEDEKRGESSLSYDTSLNLAPASEAGVSKTGYTLKGWTDAATSSALKYIDQQSVKNLTTVKDDVVKLWPVWDANNYKVEYYDGNKKVATKEFKYDVPSTLADSSTLKISKPNKKLKGWSKNTDGDLDYVAGQRVQNLTAENDGIIKLYTVWESNNIVSPPVSPTVKPTVKPSEKPAKATATPARPTFTPASPTATPASPTFTPSARPSEPPANQIVFPTVKPDDRPTDEPTNTPIDSTPRPTNEPASDPVGPTFAPVTEPTVEPSNDPNDRPTETPLNNLEEDPDDLTNNEDNPDDPKDSPQNNLKRRPSSSATSRPIEHSTLKSTSTPKVMDTPQTGDDYSNNWLYIGLILMSMSLGCIAFLIVRRRFYKR